ncbi:hypothetical protein AURDEDRAFT_26309, partial [Auricularia subglabra TFB-10046 SS5]
MLRNSSLRGYTIDGLAEKLIATLYADDTTVYLSRSDSYDDLLDILETWCLASGAKFNVKKTEMIPAGSEEFRASFIESRCLSEGSAPIPEQIRIAKDGEPTRILGSWPGNGVKVAQAWTVCLDKIQASLLKWNKTHPTLNGRSIISQVVMGGYTQYLTAAEGMPTKIEMKLEKLTLDFV